MNSPIIKMLVESGAVGLTICIILLFASLISWVIIINRYFYLAIAGSAVKNFRNELEKLKSIRDFGKISQKLRDSFGGNLLNIYILEFNRILPEIKSKKAAEKKFFFIQETEIAQERVNTQTDKFVHKLNWALHILAIMSSTAPFVGLFGTVWGIMDAFFEIGEKGSASLTVVAPGIAVSLITTVAGLLVAIPAVMFYNLFLKKAEIIEDELDECSSLGYALMKEELLLSISDEE
jgi:biopolymer transport protein TolQ